MRHMHLICLATITVLLATVGCSPRQDRTRFTQYLQQDLTVQGKAGILITALGQPDTYDFAFFNAYMTQIFQSTFPPILKPFILRDRGTVLRDPQNLFATEAFPPTTLVDCFGNSADSQGVPYVQHDLSWVNPRGGKAGHFLTKGKNGYIDICEKAAIKIQHYYYNRMPGRTVPYRRQHELLFNAVRARLHTRYPDLPLATGWAMYPDTVKQAIETLLQQKVQTIVVCDLFPVYSNLEQFAALFPEIEHMVAGRAKIIYAPSIGGMPAFRRAFVQLAIDEISTLPADDKKMLILSRHGFPEIKGEPFHDLAPAYYDTLLAEIKSALANRDVTIMYADTEFAGDDRDKQNLRMSAAEAVDLAGAQGYESVVFVLVDFLTENTDTIFCARLEALETMHFDYGPQVDYRDHQTGFRTTLQQGDMRIVFAGTPVAARYRAHLAQGICDAIGTILDNKAWPVLVR